MTTTLWVALGGAIGSVARYWLGLALACISRNFPWGTITINVLGSFIIALVGMISVSHARYPLSENIRIFIMVGLCGGFTTFSSFSLQTFELLRKGAIAQSLLNILLSVALCLCATAIGFYVAQKLNTNINVVNTMIDKK